MHIQLFSLFFLVLPYLKVTTSHQHLFHKIFSLVQRVPHETSMIRIINHTKNISIILPLVISGNFNSVFFITWLLNNMNKCNQHGTLVSLKESFSPHGQKSLFLGLKGYSLRETLLILVRVGEYGGLF